MRRCPLLGYEPADDSNEDNAIAYLERKEIGTGGNKGYVDESPCYQCPEGCSVQISEVADEMQLMKDFENVDTKEWSVDQRLAYVTLRKCDWIK